MTFDLYAMAGLAGLTLALFFTAWVLDRIHEHQTRRRRYIRRVR